MTRFFPQILLLSVSGCVSSMGTPPPRASVLFFITTDCPIANSYAPEINRIVAEYEQQRVDFEIFYTDLTQSPETVRRHSAEHGFKVPARMDIGRVQSRKYGITVTPETVVVNADDGRVYRGRIDDRYLAPGQYRIKPTTHELRDAIDAVLAGRPVAVAETKAAGCPLTE
jgi:hypothetical protein